MTTDLDQYLAVLKASYDYDPQSEDEIAIKENQILFLKEKVDEDWWKVKIKGDSQEEDSPVGLVPAAYVEQADHTSVVKALYDYKATASGELSVEEDEVLLVFETDDSWLLVQSQKAGGKAGYVPGNYVEAVSEDESTTAASQIIIPPSPTRPVSTYVDPADRVASSKVKADDIKTWSVSEIDKKGKKKKGTLGVGNGAVFFASEADKTPVQKWQTIDIENIDVEKSKHIHIEVSGISPISLHFHTSSKDNADAIVAKLEASKALSAPTPPGSPERDGPSSQVRIDTSQKAGKKASVHFSPASPVIIPPREASDEEEETDDEEPRARHSPINGHRSNGEGERATALYDFAADGQDELSVAEGEHLVIVEKDGDEWWKCRNAKGAEGVVPASYLELSETSPAHNSRVSAPAREEEADAAAEEERAEEERLQRERNAEQIRMKMEAQRRAKDAAVAEAERKKRKEAAAAAAARTSPPPTPRAPPPPDTRKVPENGASSSSSRTSSESRPPPERTRVWHDRSGQFRVEAAFLGFNNGKLRLHKVNGVVVEVPSEKMSVEDMRYVEKITSKKSRSSTTTRISEDDMPLALSRSSVAAGNPRPASVPKKVSNIDWFDFFLSAGCDLDDCTRYAASFERDKIDETILPDITDATMRSLGLREGDIIRVTKAIEKRKPTDNLRKPSVHLQEQLIRDEELARQLQAQESSSRSPAPNLFAGPGGVLKDPRRTRPPQSKSLPPSNVDLKTISTISDQIQRTTSPQLLSPVSAPTSASVQPPPRSSSAVAAASGFEDDAWTNRPSSTKPLVGTPPATTPRAPSAPPASAPAPASAPQSTPTISAPPAQPSGGLSKTTEADIFDQLSRLSELRKTASPINPPASAPPTFSTPPAFNPSPVGYQAGLGMSSSPAPMGQFLQSTPTGIPQSSPQPYNGPRGPFAPVPANQTLLQPLIPTQTGFNNFIPTRPGNTISPFHGGPSQPSLLSQQTGIPNTQPMISQPTGMFGGFNPGMPYQSNGNGGFGQVQSHYTGFNPGFSNQPQYNSGMSPPPVPPLPPTAANNTSPANIFAQMKSGTFAADNDGANPQSPDKYDALRPNPLVAQPTGWGQPYQGGYMGYQH